MDDEIQAIEKNNTWKLTDYEEMKNLLLLHGFIRSLNQMVKGIYLKLDNSQGCKI